LTRIAVNKRQRQQLLVRLLRERSVANQQEIVEALTAAGCAVTQATVSRDLQEMGLQKSRDRTGGVTYQLAATAEERRDPKTACSRMLRDFGRGVEVAQNLLVVRCDPGAAPGMGRVIDELEHDLVLGCVAGDDTVLVVGKDQQAAEALGAYLRELGG
jgi:transcriptional regulator of arginine metabolism